MSRAGAAGVLTVLLVAGCSGEEATSTDPGSPPTTVSSSAPPDTADPGTASPGAGTATRTV